MSRDDDCGSAVLEIVLVAPVLILMLAAVIGAARVTLAHQRADSAAAQAARAASTAASPSSAVSLARATALAAMSAHGLDCQNLAVRVDVADFHPGGSVSVHVTCNADLGVGVPGLSGHRSISGNGAEVIDTFRQVTG